MARLTGIMIRFCLASVIGATSNFLFAADYSIQPGQTINGLSAGDSVTCQGGAAQIWYDSCSCSRSSNWPLNWDFYGRRLGGTGGADITISFCDSRSSFPFCDNRNVSNPATSCYQYLANHCLR